MPEPGPGTDIPEPATLGLVAAGLVLLAWRRRAVKNGGAD
ncbi:PEP-CTERM sorting domain-containing protein [Sphingosinicella microcystinivorans]|nr:PEP-CTERM sorting domain-containing protein [Sphingosinicella microcystinivorans]WBX83347.1 PEP-CTERM sorting domain-containing protein [Sphingosinicella microcystinivorans]